MGDEGREEDRPIELASLVRSTCDRAYAPAFYPLRTEPNVRKGSGPDTCHLPSQIRVRRVPLSDFPRLAYRANSSAITASSAHTPPKPINAIRLSQARIGSRESRNFRKSNSSRMSAKSSRA